MDLYSVTFNSKAVPAPAVAATKARVAALLKLSDKQVEQLFSGVTVVIRRNLPLVKAQHYQAVFAKAGAMCQLVRETKTAPAAAKPGAASKAAPRAQGPQVLTLENISTYFAASIPAVRVSLRYRLALIGVSVLMVLLPLLYLGLLAAVIAAAVWHGTHHFALLWHKGLFPFVFLYLGPLAVAFILSIALLKPIFAPQTDAAAPTRLTRKDEPLFFAFLERICALVRAPMPQWVEVDCEVNASARLLPGARGFLRNQLVLRIGMPLFAGLDTRQLAGILAHEFGHFSQSAGMRANALIYFVNAWLYRCVHYRDGWDDLLIKWGKGEDAVVVIPIKTAQGAIGLTRIFITGLMWLGIGVSHLLSREMEIDADRYEAHIVGSAEFRKTAFRLRLLALAFGVVYDELEDSWNRRKLVDDLPELVARRAKEIEPDVTKHIVSEIKAGQTDLFDTHPADNKRIDNAERLNAVSAFTYVAPARCLLANYAVLAKRSTWHFYRAVLDVPIKDHQLIPIDQMNAVVATERTAQDALNSYFHGFFEPHHFMQPIEMTVATQLQPAQRREQLDNCVSKVRRAKPDITRIVAQLDKTKRELVNAHARLVTAKFTDDPEIDSLYQKITERLTATERELAPLETIFRERLALGLAEVARQSQETAREVAKLLAAHAALARTHSYYLTSYREGMGLYYLADLCAKDVDVPDHALRAQQQKLKNDISRLESALSDVDYPFARATGDVSAYAHLAEGLPLQLRDAVSPEYLDYSMTLLKAIAQLHMQIVGRLAALAAETETQFGIRVKLL